MRSISQIWLLLLLCILCTHCMGQGDKGKNKHSNNDLSHSQRVGGNFENHEFTYLGIPTHISSVDTSAGWKQDGLKMLITGTVLGVDGKTPVPNVLIYYYHTDKEGLYIHKAEEGRSFPPNKFGQTHGYIRGWVRSDAKGSYKIYTVKPGSYPGRGEPAHIHFHIKEANEINEYYIDNIVFDDDPLLTTQKRNKIKYRGGNGIVNLTKEGGLSIAKRDIVVGLNIPHYPKR